MCLGTAALARDVQKLGEKLKDEQEVLGHFADIAMATYALESALLRTRKRAAARGEDATRLQETAVRCYTQDAMDEIEAPNTTDRRGGCWPRWRRATRSARSSPRSEFFTELKRFTKREVCNTVALRRQVAVA